MRFEFSRVPDNKTTISGEDVEELQALLAALGPNEQFQLWIFKENGDSTCVLANADYAYLSVLPEEGHYLVSSNEQDPDSSDLTPIYLENGQLDEMEIGQCVSRVVGIHAGLDYFRTGTPSQAVSWIPN